MSSTFKQIKGVLDSIPETLIKDFKKLLSKIDKANLKIEVGSLKSHGVINLNDAVPNLLPIGAITSTSGIEIGKGELLAALAFEDGIMNNEANGPYDIRIGDQFWHLKAYNPNHGLRFSNKEDFSVRNTGIYKQLPKRLQEKSRDLNNTDLVKYMQKWKDLGLVDDDGNKLVTDEDVFNTWSAQCVKAAIGEASGVIWFFKDHFVVSHAIDLILFGTTQDGRIVLKCNKLFSKTMALKERYSFHDMKERVLGK